MKLFIYIIGFLKSLLNITYKLNRKFDLKIIGITFFIFYSSFGQEIEIPINEDIAYINQLSLKEDGLIVFYKTVSNEKQISDWNFLKLDTSFNQLWQTSYKSGNDWQYSGYSQNGDLLYLLFLKSNSYEILLLNLVSGEYSIRTGITPFKKSYIDDFKVIGNNAVWGGSIPPSDGKMFLRTGLSFLFFPLLFVPNFIPDREAFAISLNLGTNSLRHFPFNFKGFSTVSDIISDTIHENYQLFVKNSIGKKNTLFINEISYTNTKIKTIKINPISKEYSLLNGKLTINNDNKEIIIGTYAKGNKVGAQGFYFSSIENGKQKFIQYQSFTKFKNFFNYLGSNQKNRIKEKIESKRSEGKDLALEYNFILHDILVKNNTFTLIAECYFPQYRSEFRTIWINGRPIQQLYEVFDGWKYSHAIVACFDENGNIIWDNWMPIYNTTSFLLEEKIIAFQTDQYTTLVFNNLGNLTSKSFLNSYSNSENQNIDEIPENSFAELGWSFGVINWYNNWLLLSKYNNKNNIIDGQKFGSKITLSKIHIGKK